MTKPRRFRLDSATAQDVDDLCNLLIFVGHTVASDHVRGPLASARARRLLLHWWSLGFNSRTTMLRCPGCGGTGLHQLRCDVWRSCLACHGSGKLAEAPEDWRRDRV